LLTRPLPPNGFPARRAGPAGALRRSRPVSR